MIVSLNPVSAETVFHLTLSVLRPILDVGIPALKE